MNGTFPLPNGHCSGRKRGNRYQLHPAGHEEKNLLCKSVATQGQGPERCWDPHPWKYWKLDWTEVLRNLMYLTNYPSFLWVRGWCRSPELLSNYSFFCVSLKCDNTFKHLKFIIAFKKMMLHSLFKSCAEVFLGVLNYCVFPNRCSNPPVKDVFWMLEAALSSFPVRCTAGGIPCCGSCCWVAHNRLQLQLQGGSSSNNTSLGSSPLPRKHEIKTNTPSFREGFGT